MPRRYQPLDVYVTLVVATGAACAVLVLGTGYETLDQFLDPELALFALCALVGELVPLKVHTRGSEGEVTTSTCFALALMLAGGPAVAMAGLLTASIVADTISRKPVKKIAFNAAQYSISVSAASLLLIFTDVPETAGPLPFGPEDLIPILGVTAIFFVVNSALVSTVVALAQGVIKLKPVTLMIESSNAHARRPAPLRARGRSSRAAAVFGRAADNELLQVALPLSAARRLVVVDAVALFQAGDAELVEIAGAVQS